MTGVVHVPTSKGLTVDELAELVDMTARNIRAHQSRGLLDPPQLDGGRAYYGGHHVARLMLVRDLQDRGFSLEAIRYVVSSPWAYASVTRSGGVPGQTPWDPTEPVPVGRGIAALREVRETLPEELQAVGLLHRRDDGTWWTGPALAALGGDLARAGVPLETIVLCQLSAAAAALDLAERFGAALEPAGLRLDHEIAPLAVRLFTAGFETALASALGPAGEQAS